MGSPLNYIQCFQLAKGHYIKFLNDDDRLFPDCVKKMVSILEAFGDRVTLITSKRNKIDAQGKKLKDDGPTSLLVKDDSFIDGRDLGNFITRHFINMIGEPTTTMFRKKDLMDLTPNILSLDGEECFCLVDFVMWLNLLAKGDAVYISEPLSEFRIHKDQDQQKSHVIYKCYAIWPQILKGAKSLGFLEEPSEYAEAIRTFFTVCKDNPIFTAPQRENIIKLCKDLKSDIPASVGQNCSSTKDKKSLPKISQKLDWIQKNEGWREPLKYVYIRHRS